MHTIVLIGGGAFHFTGQKSYLGACLAVGAYLGYYGIISMDCRHNYMTKATGYGPKHNYTVHTNHFACTFMLQLIVK